MLYLLELIRSVSWIYFYLHSLEFLSRYVLFYSQFKINTDIHTSPTRIQVLFWSSSGGTILQEYNQTAIKQKLRCMHALPHDALPCYCEVRYANRFSPRNRWWVPSNLFNWRRCIINNQEGFLVTRMMHSGMPEKVSGTKKQIKQASKQINSFHPRETTAPWISWRWALWVSWRKIFKVQMKQKKKREKRNSIPVQGWKTGGGMHHARETKPMSDVISSRVSFSRFHRQRSWWKPPVQPWGGLVLIPCKDHVDLRFGSFCERHRQC